MLGFVRLAYLLGEEVFWQNATVRGSAWYNILDSPVRTLDVSAYLTHLWRLFSLLKTRLSRFPVKREHLKKLKALSPGNEGRNLALTVLHVPYSLGCGFQPYDKCTARPVGASAGGPLGGVRGFR